ncbi:MAG: hypothetical protein V1933_04445 [Candidatus Omnitrophota bacterium]
MLNRINKKAVLLKIFYGAIFGGILCLYIEKMDFNGNPFLLIFGVTLGLFASLASTTFRVRKVVYAITGGFLSGSLLVLLNLLPCEASKDVILYFMFPVYGLLTSVAIGYIDKHSKLLVDLIGAVAAGFVSFGLFVVGAMMAFSLSWKHPGIRWPHYLTSVIIGVIMLLGIGIGECYKNDTKK